MTNLQNPELPNPVNLIEIDLAIQDLQMKLDTNLLWLTHDYARAYRHIKKTDSSTIYVPEVYMGKREGKYTYYRPTPDNDKKGMCFFVVGKESQLNYADNQYNYLSWPLGIVFSCNLNLIDPVSINEQLITQNLIRDVRRVLTTKLLGTRYRIKIKEVVQELDQVYSEFSVDGENDYVKAPQQVFRFNLELIMQEDCPFIEYDKCTVLGQNISQNEVIQCLLPNIDFSNKDAIDSLTIQQKNDLIIALGI